MASVKGIRFGNHLWEPLLTRLHKCESPLVFVNGKMSICSHSPRSAQKLNGLPSLQDRTDYLQRFRW